MGRTASEIDEQIEELAALWIEASPRSLRRIPALCGEIEELTAQGESAVRIDRSRLKRLARLSARAERRLAECVTIQGRTGGYSMQGSLECLPRVATSGWEG